MSFDSEKWKGNAKYIVSKINVFKRHKLFRAAKESDMERLKDLLSCGGFFRFLDMHYFAKGSYPHLV